MRIGDLVRPRSIVGEVDEQHDRALLAERGQRGSRRNLLNACASAAVQRQHVVDLNSPDTNGDAGHQMLRWMIGEMERKPPTCRVQPVVVAGAVGAILVQDLERSLQFGILLEIGSEGRRQARAGRRGQNRLQHGPRVAVHDRREERAPGFRRGHEPRFDAVASRRRGPPVLRRDGLQRPR